MCASGSSGRSAGSWTSGASGRQRGGERVHRRQLLALDPDEPRAPPRRRPGLGGDGRDRLAVVRASRRSRAPAGRGAAARSAASAAAGRRRSSRGGRPGRRARRVVSIAPIRARATSSVTSLTWRTSSRWMSATYACRPVTRSTPPTRAGEPPTPEVIAVRARRRASTSGRRPARPRARARPAPIARRRRQHGLDDLLVAGAAAQVAGEPLLDLGARRLRDVGEQRVRRHELARDAEPALGRAVVEERLAGAGLSRPSTASPSTVVIARAVRLDAEHQARVDAPAVDQDRARAALPDEAALLGPGQAEVVAQDVEERVVRQRRRATARGR